MPSHGYSITFLGCLTSLSLCSLAGSVQAQPFANVLCIKPSTNTHHYSLPFYNHRQLLHYHIITIPPGQPLEMGIVNDEHTVCEKKIALLKMPGNNIRFCQRCNLHMWQHCIRGQYIQRQTTTMNWDNLARNMYLVRPNGSLWSTDWDNVVLLRVRHAIKSRARKLLGSGIPDSKRDIITVD